MRAPVASQCEPSRPEARSVRQPPAYIIQLAKGHAFASRIAPRQGTEEDWKMATEVIMPQMGESIFEGTITKWLKKVGDQVEKDEPLFEISTDKVDAEIPSPVAGVLTEIKVNEGATV
jgi:biotin carboxyl carrier protein